MIRRAVIAAALLASPSGALFGQQVAPATGPVPVAEDGFPALTAGTRIRIVAPRIGRERIAGTIHAVRGDTLVIDTADVAATQRLFNPSPVLVERFQQIRVPTSTVVRLEQSRGQSRMIGMARGMVRGALIMGLVSGLGALSGQQEPSLRMFGNGVAAGAVIGTVFGAPLGYASGTERWRSVPFERHAPRPVVAAATEQPRPQTQP